MQVDLRAPLVIELLVVFLRVLEHLPLVTPVIFAASPVRRGNFAGPLDDDASAEDQKVIHQVLLHSSKLWPSKLVTFQYWLLNRDPYFMVYDNPHITG